VYSGLSLRFKKVFLNYVSSSTSVSNSNVLWCNLTFNSLLPYVKLQNMEQLILWPFLILYFGLILLSVWIYKVILQTLSKVFHSLNPKAKVTYSRQQLLNLRSKFTLAPDLYFFLKSEGFLKIRRVRAGKSVKSSSRCFKIQTVHRPRTHYPTFGLGRTGPNLNNLIQIKCCRSPPSASNLLNFCKVI
jgi:hypothetical protein